MGKNVGEFISFLFLYVNYSIDSSFIEIIIWFCSYLIVILYIDIKVKLFLMETYSREGSDTSMIYRYTLKDKKLRARAKGNNPEILLECSVDWNPVRLSEIDFINHLI